MEFPAARSRVVRFGLYEADFEQRTLSKKGARVKIQDQPLQVLELLLERPGELVSRDEIRQKLWPANTFVEFDDGLNTAIKKLRTALGDSADNPRFIETVPRRGYRFLIPAAPSPISNSSLSPVQPLQLKEPPSTSESESERTVVAVHERSFVRVEQSSWRRLLIWLVGILVVSGAIGVYFFRPFRKVATTKRVTTPGPIGATARRSLAVLDFDNASGKQESAWISTAVREMLSTELALGGKVRIIPQSNISPGLSERDDEGQVRKSLLRLGQELGADILVRGSYTTMGTRGRERIRLDMRIEDARNPETLIEEAVTGKDSELFELVSEAGARIRSRLDISQPTTTEAVGLRASFPVNAKTARYYAEGLNKLREFDGLAARDLLSHAVAEDPTFGLAHSALAETWTMLGYDEKAKREARKAFQLAGGFPNADRLAIEGTYYRALKDWGRAIEIYRTLFDAYPDDPEYGLLLGQTLVAGGKLKESAAVLDRLSKMPLTSDDPRVALARSDALVPTGDLKQAQAAAEKAADQARSRNARLLLAQAQLSESEVLLDAGDLDHAIALASDAQRVYAAVGNNFGLAAVLSVIGSAQWYQGHMDDAVRTYRTVLSIDRKIGNQRGTVGALSYLGAGLLQNSDLKGAMKAFEEAVAIAREIQARGGEAGALSEVGSVYLSEGSPSRARSSFEQSIQLYREIGSRMGEGNTLEQLAFVLIAQGELEQADRTLAQSLQIAQDTGDKILMRHSLRNLAILRTVCGDSTDARKQLVEASKLSADDASESALLKMWTAKLDMAEGRVSQATAELRDAQQQFQKTHDLGPSVQTSSMIIELLLTQGNTAQALEEARNATTLSKGNPFFEENLEVETALALVTARLGDHVAARRSLAEVSYRAKTHGFPEDELRAEVALGEVELRSGEVAAGRAQLTEVEKTARARGFLLLAREALSIANDPKR